MKRVEFFEAAQFWTEALPLGNGRLGAMLWGGIQSEFIQLNEDTLWSGGPKDWNNPKAAESLQTVRNLIWQGRYTEASNLAQSNMLGPDEGQVYQPLGDITINFDDSHNARFVEVGSYARVLDLDTALAHTSYKLLPQAGGAAAAAVAGEAGITTLEYTRETFVSHADQVVAMSVSASKPASVSCRISFDSQLPSKVSITPYNPSMSSQRIILEGQCPGNVSMDSLLCQQAMQYNSNASLGMKFSAVLEIRALGNTASLSLKSADRSLERQRGLLSKGATQTAEPQLVFVEHADSIVLLVAAASSYNGPYKDPTTSTTDPLSKCLKHLDSLANVSYAAFVTRHLQDYQPLFHRVSLELASSEMHKHQDIDNLVTYEGDCTVSTAIPTSSKLSTNDRVRMFAENEDPMLVALLFNFGRYLMLASSRPGSLATNLQGIWSGSLHPAWGCTPHTNINLQMNYWPAEICNLSECHEPLFDLISVLATNGSITAKVNYNKRGWVAHHIVDVWGLTAPCSGDPVYALWPMGGAWLCTHLWEHYRFSLDKQFLGEVAFPLLKGCAEFLLDWLVDLDSRAVHADQCPHSPLDDGNHKNGTCAGDSGQIVYLVTNPSTSPEHNFITPEGQQASVSYATAMDMAIIREIFSAIISAAHVLEGTIRIDDDFLRSVVDANNRLFPPQIGGDGLVMEWALPFQDPDVTHRHMSHLFGLYPGHSLSLQTTPALCNAASQTIIKRGKVGPGWSTAWKIALWARLWNGAKAYEMVKQVFTLVDDAQTDVRIDGGGLYANLFCAHPPFQIDGNFGVTAAIAEMLIQSDGENVYLLPAVGEKWTDGEVRGLRARGGVHVSNLRWKAGKMEEVRVEFIGKGPYRDGTLVLHYNNVTTEIQRMTPDTVYAFDGVLVAKPLLCLSE